MITTLNYYIVLYISEYFYKSFEHKNSFVDTDIITLPSIRTKRNAESLFSTSTQKSTYIPVFKEKLNGTKITKQGKFLE